MVFCLPYLRYTSTSMKSIMKKIVIISVFLLPFVFLTRAFYPMVYTKSLFVEAVALILGTLWIIDKITHRENYRIPKNSVFLIFGIYVLILVLSCINGVVPVLSFWGSMDQGTGVIFMLCLFLFALITSSLFKTLQEWRKLFVVFACSGILFTIGSLLSEAGFQFSSALNLSAMSGFLIGNSSWTGIFIAFVFFVSLALAFSPQNKTERVIGVIGMITAFFDPTLTGFIFQAPGAHFGFIGLARAGSYSLFAGIGIFALYLWFRSIASSVWRKIFMQSMLSLCIIGVVSVAIIGLNPLRNLISENAGPNRLVFWDIAVKGFKEKPLLGWGSESYQFVYGKHFNPIITTPGYAPEYWVDRSHNIYFDEIVSGGALGFLGLMSLYGIILFGLARKAIREVDTKDGLLYAGLFVGVVSFLIQGIMFFQTLIGWFVIALLSAFVANLCFIDKSVVVVAEKNNKKKNKTEDIVVRNLGAVGVVVLFCVLFNYIIIKPHQINMGLGTFTKMTYIERMKFYEKLDTAYVGNTVDLGNAFIPYHMRIRQILSNGLKEDEKELAGKELERIIIVAENGIKREKYMDVKLLLSNVGFYSLLTALKDGEERQAVYDKGMTYVEKMKAISQLNPIPDSASALLKLSLDYGEEGLDAFEKK